MGRRGPPPKPTALKILTGNPGKRALNRREPQPPRSAPTCPAWLSPEAKAAWKRIVPSLDKLNLLTLVDGDVLATYCQAFAEFQIATEILNHEGRMVSRPWKDHSGSVILDRDGKPLGYDRIVHPALKLQRDAFTRIKQFAGEFGLSPSSRSRLQVPEAKSEEVDPLDALIRGAKKA